LGGGFLFIFFGPFYYISYNVKELVFCLDNDPAGREAAVKMARKYANISYYTRLELPQRKDYNEDLQALKTSIEAYKRKEKIYADI